MPFDNTYHGDYFIVEHPTRGTFKFWAESGRPSFSWSGARSNASTAKQFATPEEAQAVIDEMPDHIGELCRVRSAARSFEIVQPAARATAMRDIIPLRARPHADPDFERHGDPLAGRGA